jgi:hypothetical protein
MTYTFDQLKEDVRKEAEALRVHATKEERERLDLKTLDPEHADLCYYGLMTGSCGSPSAHELISKCCVKLINNEGFDVDDSSLAGVEVCAPKTKRGLSMVRSATEDITYLKYISPIEAYIMLPEARNANLIAFLRDETDNLEL